MGFFGGFFVDTVGLLCEEGLNWFEWELLKGRVEGVHMIFFLHTSTWKQPLVEVYFCSLVSFFEGGAHEDKSTVYFLINATGTKTAIAKMLMHIVSSNHRIKSLGPFID